MFAISGCSGKDTAYTTNNEDGYTVSIKYDANGGSFGDTNTWTVSDCYSIKGLKANDEGLVEIPILPPDYEGRSNSIKVKYSGYDLVGWFTEKTAHTDENGDTYYTYSGKWNYDIENYGNYNYDPDTLKVDPKKTYSSEEPIITLYAAWVPKFEIKFYDYNGEEGAEPYYVKEFNPSNGTEFMLPHWVDGEATLNWGDIPERKGLSFKAAYVDGENGKELLTGDSFFHVGNVDAETGKIQGESSMNVYVETTNVKEYHIYNADQFIKNYSPAGNYTLYADLDFTNKLWPDALVSGIFSGSIEGNGHTISNVNIDCNSNDKSNYGLFGRIEETASIRNIKFDNVSLTIMKGTRTTDTKYGLFAGTVSEKEAEGETVKPIIENVSITNGTLAFAHDIFFISASYDIDLVCGSRNVDIDYSGISCTSTEGGIPNYRIVTNGSEVELIFGEENIPDQELSSEESIPDDEYFDDASREESSDEESSM